ncbi:LysR family transcriptional regulator [Pigmentiphaga soli]|uniref:LysR family transcriptional regulator n=1 Tax=Pigmentiphaga soli TaxID=1007095 RepID=A0ABP8HQF3_9BURK
MVRLEDLLVFVRAADGGSLSAAARQLNMTPAAASAAVKRLERLLDARLLARSTRSLRLTPDGERYLAHARSALAEIEAGSHALERGRQSIGGEVTLALPSDLGRSVLAGWLDEFQSMHPRVRLNLHISDRVADLFRHPVDLAVRYGPFEDSTLVTLPLDDANRRVLCGAPAYFARHGRPRSPADLARHNCLRFALSDGVQRQWRFERDGRVETVAVDGDRVSDDGELVRRWALAGHGLAYKSRLDVLRDLRAGTLEAALADYAGEPVPLRLVCPDRGMLSPTVHALRELLQARIAEYLDGESAGATAVPPPAAAAGQDA